MPNDLRYSSDRVHMYLALSEAQKFEGATAPNPPVGACLVREGKILAVGAHEKAGTAHAEVQVINRVLEDYGIEAVRNSTLYVTLEPCNHTGKTPPCIRLIQDVGIRRVIFGIHDPNKQSLSGVSELQAKGIEVEQSVLKQECKRLIAPFEKLIKTGLPWVVHKLAYRIDDNRLTLIPSKGERVFTSEQSLKLAHFERKRSDAILTGSGTVLADLPMFTVRLHSDHPEKKRFLVVLSRKGLKLPEHWVLRQRQFGFEILCFNDLREALQELGLRRVLRVLVEAGPRLSHAIESSDLWDERLVFISAFKQDDSDYVIREYR